MPVRGPYSPRLVLLRMKGMQLLRQVKSPVADELPHVQVSHLVGAAADDQARENDNSFVLFVSCTRAGRDAAGIGAADVEGNLVLVPAHQYEVLEQRHEVGEVRQALIAVVVAGAVGLEAVVRHALQHGRIQFVEDLFSVGSNAQVGIVHAFHTLGLGVSTHCCAVKYVVVCEPYQVVVSGVFLPGHQGRFLHGQADSDRCECVVVLEQPFRGARGLSCLFPEDEVVGAFAVLQEHLRPEEKFLDVFFGEVFSQLQPDGLKLVVDKVLVIQIIVHCSDFSPFGAG